MGRVSTRWSTFYAIVATFVVGVFLWVQCTRISYPSGIYDEIRHFSSLVADAECGVDVDLTVKFLGQSTVLVSTVERLKYQLADKLMGGCIRNRCMVSSEVDLFVLRNISDETLDDYLDREHCPSSNLNHYCLFLIHRTGLEKRGVIGRHRLAWIEIDELNVSSSNLSAILTHLLSYMTRNKLRDTKLAGKNEYKLLFNLINEDDTQLKSWDFENIEKEILGQTIKALNSVLDLTIESQILYYHQLGLAPIYDQKKNYYFAPNMLKESLNYDLITSRSKLDTFLSETVLYFNLFIPSATHSPIVIRTPSYEYTPAFCDLDFGGFVFHSCDPQDNSSVLNLADLDLSFGFFRAQLRQLIGFSEFKDFHTFQNISFHHLPNKRVGFTQWELDSLARQLISKNLLEVKKILHTFLLILDQKYVALEDHILQLVELSIENSIKSHSESEKALEYSSRSLSYARQVESDPTLLPIYAFPTEKTYIAYFPLVISLSFPAIRYLLEQRKRRKNTK